MKVIKFNLDNKEELTFGECLDPAMEITNPDNANQYFRDYVKYIEQWTDHETAIKSAKRNLGYYAGYYSSETRARVEKLFKTAHPYFGSIAENGEPTAKKAFEMGKSLSKNQSPKRLTKEK